MEGAGKGKRAAEVVQDPAIVPPARWAPAIFEALARAYEARGDLQGAMRVDEVYLARWPSEREAPFVHHHLATLHDAVAARLPEDGTARVEAIERACDVRLKMTAYLGDSGWVSPYRLDPGGIMAVEALVLRDVRRAAADRTNLGTALISQATSAAKKTEQEALLVRAAGVYGRAARDWTTLLDLREEDETRYWLADAWVRRLQIEELLGGLPAPDELASARSAVRSAVATNARSTYLAPSAWLAIAVADLALRTAQRRYEQTRGAEGIPKREQVETTGENEDLQVVRSELPREVEEAVAARDAYLARVPEAGDDAEKRAQYAFQAGEHEFLYGRFDEAKVRYGKVYPARCGHSELGFRAWTRLNDIAALEHDIPTARALAEAAMNRPCYREEPHGCPPPRPGEPIGFRDAYHSFDRAQRAQPGLERDRLWREAGDLYREALEHAPDRDEAPEAAINGAYAYKQIGAFAEAMAMYRRFVPAYGSEKILVRLEKQDPARYHERIKYLAQAQEDLATGYVLSFDYEGAAETFGSMAKNARLPASTRTNAAHNAAILHAVLGRRAAAQEARAVLAKLEPPADTMATADWGTAQAAIAAWDERAPDTGANRAARLAAQAEVDRFVAAHERRAGAEAAVVRAAHAAAKLRRAGGDRTAAAWCRRTVQAFERHRASAKVVDGRNLALDSPEADLAAECAYAEIDAAIRADLGAPRRYEGGEAAILRAFGADMAKVDRHTRALDDLQPRFGARRWITIARARRAAILDEVVRRLDAVAPRAPAIARARADAISKVARGYVEALLVARYAKVDAPEIAEARRRLSAIARALGDVAMRAACAGVVDPVTHAPIEVRDGMFATPPGMLIEGSGDPMVRPLPVVP
jgi:tetratricopeptide (TPR) repeat protein